MSGNDSRMNPRIDSVAASIGLLCLVTLLGLLVRLYGLDTVSLSHPEIYVPGIPLPEGISEPPPRHDFLFTLWWHFHKEPHPIGWYLAMLGWTDLFGTSTWALRLPSAIFGSLTIPVTYLVARKAFGPLIGMTAAFALALHGYHIEWSQIARMYVVGAFFGMLALWLAMILVNAPQKRPGVEFAYFLVLVAGVQTTELFWGIFAAQIGWLALVHDDAPTGRGAGLSWAAKNGIDRLLQVQSMALMVGATSLLQSVYLGRSGAAGDPTVQFIEDYLSFGFLFRVDQETFRGIPFPLAAVGLFLAFSTVLIAAAFRSEKVPEGEISPLGGVDFRIRIALAVASCALLFWLATIAHHRRLVLMVVAVTPLLALAGPAIVIFWRSLAHRYFPVLFSVSHRVGRNRLLLAIAALLVPGLFFVASFHASVLAPRAFLVFVPPLIVLLAAGVVNLSRIKAAQAALMAALLVISLGGIWFRQYHPILTTDYKSIAADLSTQFHEGDLVLVRPQSWADTPLFYYLKGATYITTDYEARLAAEPERRVWLITWGERAGAADDPRRAALAGYARVSEFRAYRAHAELFVRQ